MFPMTWKALGLGENGQKIVANSAISKKLSVRDLRNIKNILNVNDNATTDNNIDKCSDDNDIAFNGNFKQKADKDKEWWKKNQKQFTTDCFLGITKALWISAIKNHSQKSPAYAQGFPI